MLADERSTAIGRLGDRRILHCDISCNNVRLWRPPSGRIRGMLIDLEKACSLNAKGENSDQIHTVRPWLEGIAG